MTKYDWQDDQQSTTTAVEWDEDVYFCLVPAVSWKETGDGGLTVFTMSQYSALVKQALVEESYASLDRR